MKATERVVIMDDEQLFRRPFSRQLRRGGLGVRVATSLRHLKTLCRSETFDAAVLDIRMTPNGIEGLTAVVDLRKAFPNMYIEVITGHEEHAESARKYGADAVFIKPEVGDAPAQRIKEGILQKRLDILAARANLEFQDIVVADTPLAEASFYADVVTNCVDEIDQFFRTQSSDIGLSAAQSRTIRQKLVEVLAVRATQETGLTSAETSDNLSADPNLLQMSSDWRYLLEEYSGRYVAYVDGKLVAHGDSMEEIRKELAPFDNRALVKLVRSREKTISFRRPVRIVRR